MIKDIMIDNDDTNDAKEFPADNVNLDEFYDECPDFEEFIDKIKGILRKSIKKEFLEDMEALRKENRTLREANEALIGVIGEHEQSRKECERMADDIRKELVGKRIHELITENFPTTTVYVIKDSGPWYVPKCDKCDDDRMIHFKSPSGKDFSEPCPRCGKTYHKLTVEEGSVYSLKYIKECGFDWYVFDATLYSGGKEVCMKMENKADDKFFDDVSRMMKDWGQVFFLSKNKANAYVEWVNKDLPNNLVREEDI